MAGLRLLITGVEVAKCVANFFVLLPRSSDARQFRVVSVQKEEFLDSSAVAALAMFM